MKTKMKKVPELRFPEFNGEWVEKRLGELVEKAKSGGTPKSTIKKYYSGNIPFLSINDMTNQGKYLTKTSKTISEEGLKNSSAWIVPVNSIIYSMYASVGLVSINKIPLATSQAVINLIVKNEYKTEYIYYYLLWLKKYIHKYIEKGTQENLNAQIVKNFKIHLPPTLEEQETIAEFLSLIDKKIELNEKKLEALKKYKKGMLQKLLNVNEKGVPELRFPEFSGKWVEKKLGEVLKERKEYSKKTDDITHLTLSKDGVFPKTKQFNRDFLVVNKNKKYKITYFNDICYNPANLKFGVICRNKYGKGIFSPIYITFETYNINPVFIENIITSDTFINKALKYQEGTVYERMAVKPEDLLKLKIFIPPTLEEQKTIAEFLSLIDKKIELNEKKLEALKKYKKGLLQKMFV